MSNFILSAMAAAADAKKKYAPGVDTTRRQAYLYGDFMRKLRTGTAVTINALGDSTTYGYDAVSADKVAPPAEPAPDGSVHTVTRSPIPWPAAMQTNLEEVYGAGKVTVINRGFSGDTTKTSFDKWITSSGAGLTLISLGINDANQNVGVQAYIDSFEKLILREINDYGAAVVILTPFKQQTYNPSRTIDTYRAALNSLATKYGIPLIDAETWLAGYGPDVFSDGTHMNTKGYGIVGARAAALFIGEGPANVFPVSHGSRLSTRPTLDNITYGPGSTMANTGNGAGTPGEGNTAGTGGVYANLSNSSVYYSFYTATADLMVSVAYGIFNPATFTATLDFGVEQPDNILDEMLGESLSFSNRAPSSWSHVSTATVNMTKADQRYVRMLRVATPGWHTLRLTASGSAAVRVLALEFLSQRTFQPPSTRTTLTLTTGTANYSPTYGFVGPEVTLDGGVGITSPVAGTWYQVATLPAGYTPEKYSYYPTAFTGAGGIDAYVRVQLTGVVEVMINGTTTGAVMLNGIRFRPAGI